MGEARHEIPFQYHPGLGQRTRLPCIPQGAWLRAKKDTAFQIEMKLAGEQFGLSTLRHNSFSRV